MDIDKLVLAARNIRDAEHEIQKKADAEIAELKAKREKIEAFLMQHLIDNNVDSLRTANGTIFRSIDTIPQGQDWDLFYRWVKDHDAFDALERRIKRTFIADYMEAHDGEIPPGVSVFRQYKLNIRKPTGKATEKLGE